MCHNKTLNNKINRIHHRALSIVYRDYTSSFESLLEKSNSVTIHIKNVQNLAIEIYKAQTNLSPLFMSNILSQKIQNTTFGEKIALFLMLLARASMV